MGAIRYACIFCVLNYSHHERSTDADTLVPMQIPITELPPAEDSRGRPNIPHASMGVPFSAREQPRTCWERLSGLNFPLESLKSPRDVVGEKRRPAERQAGVMARCRRNLSCRHNVRLHSFFFLRPEETTYLTLSATDPNMYQTRVGTRAPPRRVSAGGNMIKGVTSMQLPETQEQTDWALVCDSGRKRKSNEKRRARHFCFPNSWIYPRYIPSNLSSVAVSSSCKQEGRVRSR